MYRGYKTDLFIAWTARIVFLVSLGAVVALLGGCNYTINGSSTGSLIKDTPPSTNTVTN